MILYDVFLKKGVAQGSRRTVGHIKEDGLKGRGNCEKRQVVVIGPLRFFQVWALA